MPLAGVREASGHSVGAVKAAASCEGSRPLLGPVRSRAEAGGGESEASPLPGKFRKRSTAAPPGATAREQGQVQATPGFPARTGDGRGTGPGGSGHCRQGRLAPTASALCGGWDPLVPQEEGTEACRPLPIPCAYTVA